MPFKKGNKKGLNPSEIKAEAPVEIKPESPTYKAFYIVKNKGVWNLVIADIKDDKVISKQSKEAANKALSLEEFKIAFSKTYYFGQ